jgi:hypothetical protein
MRTFRAQAFNDAGFTFVFFFSNCNWHSIEFVADEKLAEIIANDPLHQKNGPWYFRNIDTA